MRITKNLRLGRLVTFAPNRGLPIHNWFQFKEGFSRDLVFMLAESFGLREGDWVLDPCCGCGTTLLAYKQLGINSVGFDVHPIMVFVSKVKARDYDVDALRLASKELLKAKFERPGVEAPGFVSRAFPRPVLEDVMFFKRAIAEVDDEAVRDFLSLGLMSAAMKCSWACKDGAAIKVVERSAQPLRWALKAQLARMCRDVERFEGKRCQTVIERCDARELKLKDESVDAAITSPPYLWKGEYIGAFRIEQWILGLDGPDPSQLIGADANSEDFSEVEGFVEGLPESARIYFRDIALVVKELYRVCKPGARVCLVTSDGCSPEGVVEVCTRLSRIAEEIGFRARRMIVVNRRYCTTPARRKIGVTQESLLLWSKSQP